MLTSTHIYIRKVKQGDQQYLFQWENDPDNWEVSDTKQPFSREEINHFVINPPEISITGELRMMICLVIDDTPIGCVDLFQYNAANSSVGIGILIAKKSFRNKGYATEAIQLMLSYCRNELSIVNVFCNIFKDNIPSIRLFEKCGFQYVDERLLGIHKVNYYTIKIND